MGRKSGAKQSTSTTAGKTPQAAAFQFSFKYRFEAAHRFTESCADSCATPHGHTWYATAIFQAAESGVGDGEMVMEFAKLKRAWKAFIQNTVDHSFLHHHADPILGALRKEIPLFRGLPFPGDPTTEMIAMLFFAKLKAMHAALPEAEAALVRPIAVAIRETPTNSIVFREGTGSRLLASLDAKYAGWWQTEDPTDRGMSTL